MRKKLFAIILLAVVCQLAMLTGRCGMAYGKANGSGYAREYTDEHPLVYEDAWEKWPYAFINDEGEPDGFNVELVKMLMKRLDIPYVIKLKDQDTAHEDLKHNKADLSFGVSANYNATFGRFGNVTVSLFENGMLMQRKDSVPFIPLSKLKQMKVKVKTNSRAYHYLTEKGFTDSTITVVDNMEAEIFSCVTNNEGGLIWNTMMLKWMMNKYGFSDRFVVVPIEIPPGEYRFMSGDTLLLHKLDSVAEILRKEGVLEQMTNKWMYPEKEADNKTIVFILIGVVIMLILAIVTVQAWGYYRKYYSRNSMDDVRSLMSVVLDANNIQVWIYNPLTRRYAWMTSDGLVNEDYSSFDFSQFYPDADFNIIHTQVMEFLSNEGEPVVKTLRSYSPGSQGRILDVEVHMQVLRDDYGKVYLVCGVQHDITDSKASLSRQRLLHQRHKVAFNIAIGAMMRFDGDGQLIDINDRCCIKMGIKDRGAVLAKGYNIRDFGVFSDIDPKTCPDDYSFCTHVKNAEMSNYVPFAYYDNFNPDPENHPGFYTIEEVQQNKHEVPTDGYYYVHLIKSHNKEGKLLSYVMYLLDITEETKDKKRLDRKKRLAQELEKDEHLYRSRLEYTLAINHIILVHYFPDTKTLEFFDRSNEKQYTLSQLQLLEMVNSKDMKKVFKVFRQVDSYSGEDLHITVGTYLRNADGDLMYFSLDAHPVYDDRGRVKSYFGICTDVTEKLRIDSQLRQETQRAREAEHVKQMFLRNMSYSIRQPLIAMRQSIDKLAKEKNAEKEHVHLNTVTSSTQRLINLSDDTLLLSRIEAGLYVSFPKQQDFGNVYVNAVEQALKDFRTEGVIYNVTNTYDNLLLHFDTDVISRIIREAVSLSARYTQYGVLSVRYFFSKDTLGISIEDTGQGIPPSILDTIYEPRIDGQFSAAGQDMRQLSGLEMPICAAFVHMLGGTIDIDSTLGKGTTIFISLPMKQKNSDDTTSPDSQTSASQPPITR